MHAPLFQSDLSLIFSMPPLLLPSRQHMNQIFLELAEEYATWAGLLHFGGEHRYIDIGRSTSGTGIFLIWAQQH